MDWHLTLDWKMFNSLTPFLGLPVHKDKHLGYQIWCIRPDPPRIRSACVVAGEDAYAQILYAIEIKPNISDLDPGPLDAKVP